MKAKHIIFIVLGIILAVIGMVVLIERKEMAVELVGRDRILSEAFRGGNSFKEALIVLTIGGVAGLIAGLSSLVFGFIYGLKSQKTPV